jgi:membrane protease YdiL (CAAX protease family)
MASDPHKSDYETARTQVAPWWHTGLLLLILLAVTLFGMWSQNRSNSGGAIASTHSGIAPLYVSLIIMEWALFLFVRWGLSKSGNTVSELVGGKWSDWKSIARDVAVAIPFWVVWESAGRFTHFLLGSDQAKKIDILLPQTIIEILLWVGLSVSAGICEEIVYRGYLQRQFLALTRSSIIAILAQGIIFGIGHAYQGAKQVVVITVLGLLFGLLASWRKSLRPGIISHAWSDIFGGWIERLIT